MGLFDMFKKKPAPAAAPAPAPTPAPAAPEPLCAPIAGKVIAMADVPDPVFSGEVLGKGCAVWPEGDTVCAPAAGTVTVTMGHAVGLVTETGVEILVHIGVDTVNMQGEGFDGFVKEGDTVTCGQPLIKMDRSAIAKAGYKDCVVVAISNSADYASIDLAVEPNTPVAAGDPILKIAR